MKHLLILLMVMAGLSSCAAREVIYLGDGTTKTVRLRETVKGVNVWVKDSTGTTFPAEADLLEGGYYRSDLTK
jgi:hypothetical protein